MKKRILALVLSINCTVFMTACGNSEKPMVNEEHDTASQDGDSGENTAADDASKQSTPDDADTKSSALNMPETLSDDLYDFQISIDGTVYQFPMWYSDFEALGWEFDGDSTETLSSGRYRNLQRWSKDNASVCTLIGNLSMNTVAFSDSMVAGIYIGKYDVDECDWEILLPGGIQYGVSTTDDIKEAYGKPTSDIDSVMFYQMTYYYDKQREIELCVDKDSGVLEVIRIDNLVELEGTDNSVSAEVPDIIKNYEAPTELGDDFYSFHVELEGNLYKLPCPVSEFLANGFTIDESKSDMEIASGKVGRVYLHYNNKSFSAVAENYADYATTVENCMLTKVESNFSSDFALTIPGNIKKGDSEDDLKKAIEGFNVEVYEPSSGGFTTYSIYDPDGDSLDCYDITVKNGVVDSIKVSNKKEPE